MTASFITLGSLSIILLTARKYARPSPVILLRSPKKMMFLFAYIGSFSTPPGWPFLLMYLTEAALVIATLSASGLP